MLIIDFPKFNPLTATGIVFYGKISQNGKIYLAYAEYTLKKVLVREDQYLYVARRTFRNLFLRVIYLENKARNFKNEMLPEKADISLLKISICISVSAIGIQANLLVGWGGGRGSRRGRCSNLRGGSLIIGFSFY